MVVLAVHPGRVGDVGGAEEREQLAADVGARREPRAELDRGIAGEPRLVIGGPRQRPVVHRTVAEAPDRHVGDRRAVGGHLRRVVADRRRGVLPRHADRVEQAVVHAEPAGVGDPTDDRRADLPPLAQRQHLVEMLRRHDREHALLALGGEHLDRVHPRLAMRRPRHVDVHARAGLGRGLRGRTRDAGGAEVLHADREPRVEEREAGLDELLLLERIAHLHRRSLRLAALLEAGGREHARAADAVAPGGRAEQDREVVHPLGACEHEPVDRERAETEHVDERVVAVALVEHELAADGRYADRVAVPADPAHDALEEVAGARVVERPEPQRVHERDRARPHREDVADDAADAGGRTLVRLHRRRVVVALDAHGHRHTVADVDHAGALAGTDQHPRRLGGEASEVGPRRLVGAVLRPHHRVHRQLEVGRLAPELVDHRRELVVGHAELPVQGGLRHRAGHYRDVTGIPCPSRAVAVGRATPPTRPMAATAPSFGQSSYKSRPVHRMPHPAG